METGESQLQTTFTPGPKMPFTPGPWLHPGLKVGCVFAARQNDLADRVQLGEHVLYRAVMDVEEEL